MTDQAGPAHRTAASAPSDQRCRIGIQEGFDAARRLPSLRLAPIPGSARQARQHVRTALAAAGHELWADDAALAVTELVTNVIRHAHTDCEVCVCVSPDAARVGVRDYDPTPPIHRHLGPLATTGRGIPLVAGVTSDFGITPLGAGGKVVWFSFQQRAAC